MLGKSWRVLGPAAVLAAASFFAWPHLPKRYRSEAILAVADPLLSEEALSPVRIASSADDLLQGAPFDFTRSELALIIDELQLYPSDVQRMPMEHVVERMREDVEVQVVGATTVRVAAISTDPEKARETANRLASIIIARVSADDGSRRMYTNDFLRAELESAERELLVRSTALESETSEAGIKRVFALQLEQLEERYRSLLSKVADWELAVAVGSHGGGGLEPVDRASLPEAPLGMSRDAATVLGASPASSSGWHSPRSKDKATPCRERRAKTKGRRRNCPTALRNLGARDRIRTGDVHLGKVVLYQLSYSREDRAL